MSGDRPDLAPLRAELARIARSEDAVERTLEVVALIEAALAPLGIHPVLVGGMAVYFWTARDEFRTYDIDLVMDTPAALHEQLEALGFARAPDGRHWTLEGTEVFMEAPSAKLDPDATVTEVALPSGRTAKVLSRVDVLLDRLAEFQAGGHQIVAQQVLVLLAGLSDDETAGLDARAPARRVTRILAAMRQLVAELAAGREAPASDELHALARDALRAEYAPREP
jgi:hypothetical protein